MAMRETIAVQNVIEQTLNRKDNKGTFKAVEVIDSLGRGFSSLPDKLPEGGVQPGDSLDVVFQICTKKNGDTFNKIITASKESGSTGSNNLTKSTSKVFKKYEKTPDSPQGYNGTGARVGGAYHDAVAIAIANAKLNNDTQVNLGEVETIANQLIDAMGRSEKR